MTEFRTERDTMGEVRLPADAYYGPQTQRAVENFPISGRTLPPELIHALGLVKWAAATVNRDLGRFGDCCNHRVTNSLEGGVHTHPHDPIDALLTACREVADGKWDHQFPIDVFQTGSGTSSNMNANEVIAHRANELSAIGGQLSEAGGQGSGQRSGARGCHAHACRGHVEARQNRHMPTASVGMAPSRYHNRPIHPNDHVNLGQSSNDVFPTAIHVAVAAAIRGG